MKKSKFFAVLFATVLFTITFVVVQSCQKTPDVQEPAVTGLDDESKIVVEHIQNFKKKMEFYRDNPGLKSNEKQYVLDAILDWESTLNFDYCYSYVDVSDIKIYDTLIAIPVDGDDSMAIADVSDKYYNDILVAVQTHYYVYAPFTSQKLLAVDLEPTTNYDSVVVSTWIGNDTPPILHPEYDWKFGELRGTCDNNYVGESDAAQKTAKHVRFTFYEDPPEGKRWTFPNPITIEAKPLDENPDGSLKYINPDDDEEDNYLDYLIYYASQSVPPGLTTGVRCVEAEPELNFYKQSYVDLTQGWIDAPPGGRKFKECSYWGADLGAKLQHELETIIGKRFITDILEIDLPPID